MNKKFLELVKRQAVLAAKSAQDKLSKEEAAELAKISAAIKAATEADEEAATTLKTMTLAEFKAWHEDAVQKIEDGDMDLLPLVKKNLAAVKAQGVTDSEGLVAVELPVEKSEADVIAALEDRIAALEAAKQDDMDGAGDGDGDENGGDEGDGSPEPAQGKQGDKPTAQALAMEAIDTLLEKYGKIKAAIESGELTKDQLDSLWDDWPLKDAIRTSAAIMTKCDELKAAAEAVLPELEKLDDGDGGEGDGNDGEDGDGDESDGDEGDDDVSKASSAWFGGRDLAAKDQTPEEQAAQIRKAKERGRD